MSAETPAGGRTDVKLTVAQNRALRGVEMLRQSGGADMATLRANGHRRDVLDRLCLAGLVYVAGDYGHGDRVRFDLTDEGRKILAALDAQSAGESR